MRAALNHATGIPLRFANRHGLITGQTGMGKSVTLIRLAEQFSLQGVPVFVADIKGDIAALSRSSPSCFLDVFGERGRRARIPFHALGPDLVARALDLSDAQSGAIDIAFALARDECLPLSSIADMRAVLQLALARRADVQATYGQITPASVGVIMRALLRLESEGAAECFGDPAFDVADLLTSEEGRGVVSILEAGRLANSPRLYSAFTLYLLADLFSRLPESGDLAKPRLVVFVDEAHLLFADMPAGLLRRIEQIVRLIRSRGVGLYFVTQAPGDIPPPIAEQLAHRVSHDRALPVGTASVRTMTDSGRPAPETVVRIDRPSCELGALEEGEYPRATSSPPPTAQPATGAMDWHGYAFLGICAVALIGLIAGIAHLSAAGMLGHWIAGAIGGILALWWVARKKARDAV